MKLEAKDDRIIHGERVLVRRVDATEQEMQAIAMLPELCQGLQDNGRIILEMFTMFEDIADSMPCTHPAEEVLRKLMKEKCAEVRGRFERAFKGDPTAFAA